MKYASVCSGVEAASLAWMPLGWEAAWFSEIEPFPCAVLKERFPDVPNLGDMTKIKGEDYRGTVDLLVGGTPCQGFSVAGKQGGLNDPRSALCLAYCKLLETMRPRWFVWENVPGVFSTSGGEDFKAFLRKIDEIGYSCAWRVLDAQYVRVDGYPRAVPQRRRRVFVIGYLGDWKYPASVLFEPGCVQRDTPPRRIKGKGTPGNTGRGTQTANGRLWDESGVNPTLSNARSGIIGASNQKLFAQNANGLVMDVKFWNGEDVSTTLTESFSDDRMPDKGKLPCVICRSGVCAGFMGGQGAKAGSLGYLNEISPTIKASPSGSNQVPDVVCCENHYAPISFRWAASPSQGLPIGVDYCHTLMANRSGEPAVCYENHAQDSRIKEIDCAPVLSAKAGTGGGNLPIVCAHETGQGYWQDGDIAGTLRAEGENRPSRPSNIVLHSIIRRLTPRECERLMGFPDNWTRIPWRGKPAEQCPDSPRYKACGNSMCVNVMRWIGMRIENVERKMKRCEK